MSCKTARQKPTAKNKRLEPLRTPCRSRNNILNISTIAIAANGEAEHIRMETSSGPVDQSLSTCPFRFLARHPVSSVPARSRALFPLFVSSHRPPDFSLAFVKGSLFFSTLSSTGYPEVLVTLRLRLRWADLCGLYPISSAIDRPTSLLKPP
jgi:hypothetical protein